MTCWKYTTNMRCVGKGFFWSEKMADLVLCVCLVLDAVIKEMKVVWIKCKSSSWRNTHMLMHKASSGVIRAVPRVSGRHCKHECGTRLIASHSHKRLTHELKLRHWTPDIDICVKNWRDVLHVNASDGPRMIDQASCWLKAFLYAEIING